MTAKIRFCAGAGGVLSVVAETKLEEFTKQVDEKISLAKKEVLEGVMKDHYLDTLKKVAGDDAELIKKVEYQYGRLADSATTKDEVTKKIQDAFILATGGNQSTVKQDVFSSANANGVKVETNSNLSDEEKQMAKELARRGGMVLEDKDFK